MGDLVLRHVRVAKGGREVLRDVTFAVPDGACHVVLGASGAGKTLLLRTIGGFEPLQSGHVVVGGRDLAGVPPRDRNLAMVTSIHKLQPHLDVGGNLAFPLRARRAGREEIERRVDEEARAFWLQRLLRRRPHQLSGGETQTAALARTLVRPPAVVLLDSPLAHIDPIGRGRALRELRRARERHGVTMLLTTNDQAVAGSVGERVVVLDRGAVLAAGTYRELYARPPEAVVGQLIGTPPMNLLPARAARRDGRLVLAAAGGELHVEPEVAPAGLPEQVTVGLRPEDLELVAASDPAAVPVRITLRQLAGHLVHLHGEAADGRVLVAVGRSPGPAVGERVAFRPRRVHVFDRSGRALAHGRHHRPA